MSPPIADCLESPNVCEAARIDPDDSRVIALLETYIDELDSGLAPDADALLRRHPHLAEALRPALEGVALLQDALAVAEVPARSLSDSTREYRRSAVGPGEEYGTDSECGLGDFRILQELGRGGMGVVYEAEQLSLSRRVALKVLPPAATLDPRQRARFRSEAQAAALLQHPNIVPVFSIGSEHGLPFYVMQLVEGPSLAAVIQHLRGVWRDQEGVEGGEGRVATALDLSGELRADPSSAAFHRGVARLGQQAALALDHAHQEGILHRDIKPGNLLLDRRGDLWITDFGLARRPAESGVTHTGDLVGTLRYMSPEQALGRRAMVDGRTDVYALGATLYELLTLQPLFDGQDAQELLRQIGTQEPVSPRRLNPSIPRPLETIVLKALAREPWGRYASAREMADDLGRFQRDEPILARRPSLAERLAGWCRRRRTAVTAAAGVLILALAGLLLATWRVHQETNRTQAALSQQHRQRQRAEANLALALESLEQLQKQLAEGRMQPVSKWDEESAAMLGRVSEFYEQIAQQNVDPSADRHLAAHAFVQAGRIRGELGQFVEAEAAFCRAVGLFENITARPLVGARERLGYSDSLEQLGALLWYTGRPGEALPVASQALALSSELVEQDTLAHSYRRRLAAQRKLLGDIQTDLRRFGDAEQNYRSALGTLEYLATGHPDAALILVEAARTWTGLGILYARQDQLVPARAAFERALELLPSTESAGGDLSLTATRDRGRAVVQLSMALIRLGLPAPGERYAREGVALFEKLVAEHPNVAELRYDLAMAHGSLGLAETTLGRHEDAERNLKQSLAMRQELMSRSPGSHRYRAGLSQTFNALAHVSRDAGRTEEAIKTCRMALAIDPYNPIVQNDLAWYLLTGETCTPAQVAEAVQLSLRATELAPQFGGLWNTLGAAHYRAGDWSAAEVALKRSMDLRSGGDCYDWFLLAMVSLKQGHPAEAQAWFDRAEKQFRERGLHEQTLQVLRSEAADAMEAFPLLTGPTRAQDCEPA